jgi:hypothetical protein
MNSNAHSVIAEVPTGTAASPIQETAPAAHTPEVAAPQGDKASAGNTISPLEPPKLLGQHGTFPDGKTSYFLSAYRQNGTPFIAVDSHDLAVFYGVMPKQAAYEYRHTIGMPNVGIEPYGSAYLFDEKVDLVPTQLDKGKKIYRQAFRLTPGL